MKLYRATFIALIAAVGLGVTHGALGQERPVIVVTVDETGRTVVRCTGIECQMVDCSGNGQRMASGNAYVVREDEPGSCTTERGAAEDEDALDQQQAQIIDLLLAGPIPGGGGGPGGVIDAEFIQGNEGNQSQVQNLGESSPASPVTPGPPPGIPPGPPL